jgi:hypothetical protein
MENTSPHGWKTYLAAAAAIIGGAALVLVNNQYEAGLTSIVAGLALIGVRGSIAKVIELLKALVAKQQ